MKKKILAGMLSIAMVSGILAGCGGTDNSTEAAKETTDTKQETTSAKEEQQETKSADDGGSQEAKTIKILSIWPEDKDNGKLFVDLTKKYMEEVNPNFNYEFELVSSDNLRQKVTTLAASNDLPDVFAYDAGTPLVDLIDAGLVLDVGSELKKLGVFDMVDEGAVDFLTGMTSTEELYDLPLGMNIEGFWYNKELFQKAGIDTPPSTWDDMLQAADKLMAADIQPFATGGADMWPATRMINAYVMRKGGVDTMRKAYKGEIKYTDSIITEGAQMLQDMVDKGYFGVGATTVDQNTAASMILSGEAAMIYNGSWYTDMLIADTNPAGEDGIGFFNIPTVEGGVGKADEYSMNCGTIICFNKDKFDDATADWLKYFVSNIGDYAINELGSLKGYKIENPPASLNKYSQLVADEMAKVKGTSTWFEADMTAELSKVAQDNVQSLMNGNMTAEEYTQSLQDIYDAK